MPLHMVFKQLFSFVFFLSLCSFHRVFPVVWVFTRESPTLELPGSVTTGPELRSNSRSVLQLPKNIQTLQNSLTPKAIQTLQSNLTLPTSTDTPWRPESVPRMYECGMYECGMWNV